MIKDYNQFINENSNSSKEQMKDLSERIMKFIDEYAAISPNWDQEDPDDIDNKYTSPDSSMLVMAAELLEQEEIPLRFWSDWESGGYKPYNSKIGRAEHDKLMKEINALHK